jgi:hypothetical protein
MVFNMFAIEGFQHKEIAQMMRIDNNIKSQYSHESCPEQNCYLKKLK